MAIARRSAHMNVMVEAAEKAGRALVRDFGEIENLQVSRKGPSDFVSAADHKSEKIVRTVLEKARPAYAMLMEESGAIKGADKSFKWIVDPLDGTSNFLHGIPHWCVTIALEKDKEIVAGVTYDPIKDELFSAEKGMGAFCNNKRLRVAGRTMMAEGMYTVDCVKPNAAFIACQDILDQQAQTRTMGSAALDLAYVAAGRFDGCVLLGAKAWDYAAGTLMIREAGGYVSTFSSGKDVVYDGSVVGANSTLHTQLLKTLKTKDVKVKSAS